MRLLEADLARNWTLPALAAELHLTPGHLVRLFKAATGLPLMAYLAQVRAEHAALLLLHSDEPVTGIGKAVGWPGQNHFARRFKAHYAQRDHLPQAVRHPGRSPGPPGGTGEVSHRLAITGRLALTGR